jgi:hypothetical protein
MNIFRRIFRKKAPEPAIRGVYRIVIPDDARPGEEFEVMAGNFRVRARFPLNSLPGQFCLIIPHIRCISFTSVESKQGPPTFVANIPHKEGFRSGAFLRLTVQGKPFHVRCPYDASPKAKIYILQPLDYNEASDSFRVYTPKAYRPKKDFIFLLTHEEVSVCRCTTLRPGQIEKLLAPIDFKERNSRRMPYDQYGWKRKYSVDHNGDEVIEWDGGSVWVPSIHEGCGNYLRFFDDASYVRQLNGDTSTAAIDNHTVTQEKNLQLVPTKDASFASHVMGENDITVRGRLKQEKVAVTALDISYARNKSFEDKVVWFQRQCNLLHIQSEQGDVRVRLLRGHMLEDSIVAIMSLNSHDLRKMSFKGKVTMRKWYSLVAEEIFHPDLGLWKKSESNSRCWDFNTAAPSKCNRK